MTTESEESDQVEVGVEEQFLQELRYDPQSESRAVYMDWLEERADPRAHYMRTEAELHALGATANDFDRAELVRLGKSFDPLWVASVTRPIIMPAPGKGGQPRAPQPTVVTLPEIIVAPVVAPVPEHASIPSAEPAEFRPLWIRVLSGTWNVIKQFW